MNITSSTGFNNKQLHFIKTSRDQFSDLQTTINLPRNESRRIIKSKSIIRIKEHPSTQEKNRLKSNKQLAHFTKKNAKTIIFPPGQKKYGQRELLFLRDLVTRKKEENEELDRRGQRLNELKGKKKRNNKEEQFFEDVVKDILGSIRLKKEEERKKLQNAIKFSESSKNKFLAKCYLENEIPETRNISKASDMTFKFNEYFHDSVYERKIISYLMFLYKVNFSNSIYVDLALSSPAKVYKVKIQLGNNGQLIRSLINRRFWLEETNKIEEASFVWTQMSRDQIHKNQQPCQKKKEKQRSILFMKKIKKLRKLKNKEQFVLNEKILKDDDIYVGEINYQNSNICQQSQYPTISPKIITNHIPQNYFIASKKILFLLMHWYYSEVKELDPFYFLPQTYHIRSGEINNQPFRQFLQNQEKNQEKVWIVKPGENTNRGIGITVASFKEVGRLIRKRQVHKNGQQKTYIIQEYIKPFLYYGRKIDIRHYLLITSVNGYIKAYWFKDGYIRTCSEPYDLEDLSNQFVHLTNDSIQKRSENYGKYEPGNKLTYSAFQRYLDTNYPHKRYSFENRIIKKIKQITKDLVQASFSLLDSSRKSFNFQLFGMDFLINSKFHPYLIEVNANPCLEMNSPVLQKIIPILTQHTLRLAVDPLLPPTSHYSQQERYNLSDRMLEKIKYELIFDEKYEGAELEERLKKVKSFELEKRMILQADEELFTNKGVQYTNLQLD